MTLADQLNANRSGLEVRELLLDPRGLGRLRTAGGGESDVAPGIDLDAGTRRRDEPNAADRLQLNGLFIAVMSEVEAATILSSVDAPMLDQTTFYGQATEWRELVVRQIGRPVAAIIDGAAAPLYASRIKLMGRGWSMDREDGPALELELQAIQQIPTEGRGRLSTIKEAPVTPDRTFDSTRWEGLLRPGEVAVITTDAPAAGGIGPQTVAPPTLGRLLLGADPVDPTRQAQRILVFRPVFSAASLAFVPTEAPRPADVPAPTEPQIASPTLPRNPAP